MYRTPYSYFSRLSNNYPIAIKFIIRRSYNKKRAARLTLGCYLSEIREGREYASRLSTVSIPTFAQ
jgi:hypothetical protein